MVIEDGADRNRVVIIAVTIALAFAFSFLQMPFTGFAVYSIEENHADGEAMVYPNGTYGWNSTGDYTRTFLKICSAGANFNAMFALAVQTFI